MLVIPACSWFVYFISALGMGISMQIKNNVVLKGSKVHLRLIKKNKYNLAFVNGQIHVKYMYYHTGDEFSYTVDIKSGLGKSAGVIDIPVDYCGYIYLWVEYIDMCDYLGLFHKRKKYTGLSKVYIVPGYSQADIIQTDGGYSEDMDDAVLYLKSAGDEVSELRKYREGDSPRYIHWKKSSILAEDDFIIKEYDNKKILLVDDSETCEKIIKKILRGSNITIERTEYGKYCLDKIRSKEKYDLILIKYEFKPLDGYTIMTKLQEIRNFNIPCILLTKNTNVEYDDSYQKYGFKDYIIKSNDKNKILNTLDKYLK